ncbi:hypothetical protein FRX31_005232 [Thalictrum thalictroides]|uniref:Uncharacterized protein n=1 Tax=Thalictrum thalictroides TaxID=46969 RepID=A0A7J6X8G1_THATH|nr:hypothetical protein FRX31_005232 [Thalictrum thalictroides]
MRPCRFILSSSYSDVNNGKETCNYNHVGQEAVLSNDDNEEPIQLKFKYDIEEPEKVEKSDDEKLIDSLWDDYDFVLASIGRHVQVETEVIDEPNAQRDSSSHCRQGYHDLILDDQVGVKCRCCSFVQLEIKYVLPPNSTSTRSGRRTSKEYANTRHVLIIMMLMVSLKDLHSMAKAQSGTYFHEFKRTCILTRKKVLNSYGET